MNSQERYALWCEKADDAEVREQLKKMAGDADAIENAFYKELGACAANWARVPTA